MKQETEAKRIPFKIKFIFSNINYPKKLSKVRTHCNLHYLDPNLFKFVDFTLLAISNQTLR